MNIFDYEKKINMELDMEIDHFKHIPTYYPDWTVEQIEEETKRNYNVILHLLDIVSPQRRLFD